MSKQSKLTEKQRRFVDYYIQTANATKAAKLAGYSPKTAYSIGEENLRKPEIRRAIEVRLKKLESQRIAETKEVLEHLTSCLRGELTEEIATPTGKKITVAVREVDRLRAAEYLLRVNGAFKEKLDVKVDGAQLFVQTMEKIYNKENEGSAKILPLPVE